MATNSEPRTVVLRAAGCDVHAVEHGDPAAPVLLTLHGFPVDQNILRRPVEAVLAGHPEWRRLHVDIPGFGASPPAASITSSDDVLELVLELVDDLAAAGPLLLVGQSWGGYLAAAAAARRPDAVAGVALVCPLVVPVHAERDVPPHVALVVDPDLAGDPAELAEFREIAVHQDARNWAAFREDVLPGLRAADVATVERIGERYGLAPSPLAPYAGPMLIVTGRQDSVTGWRDVLELLDRHPRSTFAVLDAAGHNAHVEREEVFAALLADWLERVAAERLRPATER